MSDKIQGRPRASLFLLESSNVLSARNTPVSRHRTPRDASVEELERRIEALEELDESAFGTFTRLDWLICVLGSLVVPSLALWWFGG